MVCLLLVWSGRLTHRYQARTRLEAGLLNGVDQLVRNQSPALDRHHVIATAAEDNVTAYRVAGRPNSLRRIRCCGIPMDPNVSEILRESALEQSARAGFERLSARSQDGLHRRRREPKPLRSGNIILGRGRQPGRPRHTAGLQPTRIGRGCPTRRKNRDLAEIPKCKRPGGFGQFFLLISVLVAQPGWSGLSGSKCLRRRCCALPSHPDILSHSDPLRSKHYRFSEPVSRIKAYVVAQPN